MFNEFDKPTEEMYQAYLDRKAFEEAKQQVKEQIVMTFGLIAIGAVIFVLGWGFGACFF